MKKLTAIIMVAMLVLTGVCPAFATTPTAPVEEDIAPASDIMPLVDYVGPYTTYVEEIIVAYGIFEGDNVKFTNNKLTVSAGAVNNSAATVSSSYVTVRLNKYLPGGTYVTIASQRIPVDGESHAIVVGMDIDTNAVYMFSYSLTSGNGALIDVVTVGHSYSL
jgi:hypothetical protein